MVVESSDKKHFFYVLNPFLKFTRPDLTRPDPTMTRFDGLCLGQYHQKLCSASQCHAFAGNNKYTIYHSSIGDL